MILYEFPFNERIRTLLRLEELFNRLRFFLSGTDAKEHHIALMTLFEIDEVIGRLDLKADLARELERQRQTLAQYRNNPAIEPCVLEAVHEEIARTSSALNQIQGKIGQSLADNEWLNSIRSRAIIPGGTCRFDLPSYYAWQQNPAEQRQLELSKWAAPFLPLCDAIAIVLKFARETNQARRVIAMQGCYQQMLSGRTAQLMQVRVSRECGFIPEASANKYMLWIRFTIQNGSIRPQPVNLDISFQLNLCHL